MNIKKLTKKGADGSSIIYEFDVPKMDSIPNHPGEPKGPDTVPAWLTPGEFVVNAEATRMFEPQIEAMNEAGKAVQRQQGGTIPQYKADGGGILSDDDIANLLSATKPKEEAMYGSTVPDLNFYGQLPPSDNPEYIQDNFEVTTESLANRYNGQGRQNPAVPAVNSMGQDPLAGVPNVDSLPPMGKSPSVMGDINANNILDSLGFDYEAGKENLTSTLDSISGLFPTSNKDGSPTETRNIVTDEFGEGVLPGEGSRAVTTFRPPQNLAELTGGFLGWSEDVEKVRSQAQKDKAIANDIASVINNPDLTSETKNLNPKDAEEAGTKLINEDEKKEDVTGEGGKDSFLSKVSNFFTENFKDLIDDDKLMNAALLYAGSRALGYSHGGSLNFVGRNYLSDIQKKLAVADKASLSNKYTKDSVKKYRDTGKVEDLELAKNVQLVNSEIVVNDKGEQVRVNKYEDKNTGKTVYQTEDGTSVNRSKFMTQAEANSASDRVVKGSSSIFKGNMDKIRNVDPDEAARLQALLPTDEAFGMALERVGVKYGLSPSLINSKAEVLSNNMIEHAAKTGEKLSADVVEGFLNKEFLTASLSNMGISSMLKGADQGDIDLLNSRISKEPIQLASEYKRYAKEYNDLKDKRKQYERKAPEGTTGFMIYIKEQLDAENKQ
jgi:hypothetical protein